MLIIIIAIMVVIIFVVCKVHESFVYKYSNLLKTVSDINSKYEFYKIDKLSLKHFYDNEHFFNNISTKDYLIYQLVFIKKEVTEEIKKANKNKLNYKWYKEEVDNIEVSEKYSCDSSKMIKPLLEYYTNKLFEKMLLNPIIEYGISVTLVQTNINGRYICQKSDYFDALSVAEIIISLKDKTGDKYNSSDVWESITRVERGRVSNKLRFKVYARDNYRCVKCGRETSDLEVDHIIQVSKGGKSTLDNLQTLCHKCNVSKSNFIDYVPDNYNTKSGVCPECGAPLRVVNGKYGKFYGCMNYPKCKYRKSIN